MTRLTPYAFCALSVMALSAAAQPVSEAAHAATAPLTHVRGVDEVARRVLERAVQVSPTVVRLIRELEGSDLIVTVRAGQLRKGVNGQADMAAAGSGFRYMRIVLNVPNTTSRLVEVLGHELWHAVEVAGMPGVRDSRSLVETYRRIGVPMLKGGYYETDAALEAGRIVAREVAEAR